MAAARIEWEDTPGGYTGCFRGGYVVITAMASGAYFRAYRVIDGELVSAGEKAYLRIDSAFAAARRFAERCTVTSSASPSRPSLRAAR
jgi:hypothetical protein